MPFQIRYPNTNSIELVESTLNVFENFQPFELSSNEAFAYYGTKSTGATLGKGLNRAFATLFAGALGAGAHHLAALSGHVGQPIITSIFVFLLGKTFSF